MSEHIRITKNRREFIQDAFCGFGTIAMASLAQREQLRAADPNKSWPEWRRLRGDPQANPRIVAMVYRLRAEVGNPRPIGRAHR